MLAGGASTRMGRDKATLQVGGEPLLRRAAGAAAAVARPVVVVAPAGHPARRHAGDLRVVEDPGLGPLAAVVAALEALAAPHLLVVAADHPDLQVALLRRLAAERHRGEAVACRRAGRLEPLVAAYERAATLAAAPAARSLTGLLGAVRTRVLEEPEWRALDPAGRSFLDLDEPADVAAYLCQGC